MESISSKPCGIISSETPWNRVNASNSHCADVLVAAIVRSYRALHVRPLETGAVKGEGEHGTVDFHS